jgi:hypothetical protein
MTEPSSLGDILRGTMERVVGSDEARAYLAWERAAGDALAAVSRPRRFVRGRLTVECESSAWASELSYFAPLLLERITALDPGTPVETLRFVAHSRGRRAPAGPSAETTRGQEDGAAAAKNEGSHARGSREEASDAGRGTDDTSEHERSAAARAVLAALAKRPPGNAK